MVPVYSAQLLEDLGLEKLTLAQTLALQYHEHWDGTGYPGHVDPKTGKPLAGFETADGRAAGLRGEEINLMARLLAAAHAYDRLVYQLDASGEKIVDDTTKEKALKTIMDQSGTRFDPVAVQTLVSYLAQVERASRLLKQEV